MFKYFFAAFLLFHGLIHSMGFAKAFGYATINQLSKDISKPAGIFWFLSTLLFIITLILFLLKYEYWSVTGLLAVLISQILIISVWKDAKFGTIANIVVLLVAVPSFAFVRFDKKVKREVGVLLSQTTKQKEMISFAMLDTLPPVVQQWLIRSGVLGKEKVQFVRLKQKGEMRTEPGGRWMPFTAEQYFTVNEPQFIWQVNVKMMPLITMTGRDKFINGKGEMRIKLLSLIDVANSDASEKMNAATMIRYMAETIWFPSAALNEYFSWEAIDPLSAKISMTCKNITVSGIIKFTAAADVMSFEADRFKADGEDAKLEKWLVEITGYKNFHGVRIPYKNKVTWKLKGGDFNWANIELTELDYNKVEVYP
jgi:hypothetical protein